MTTNEKHEFQLLFKPAQISFEYKRNLLTNLINGKCDTLDRIEYLSYRVTLDFGERKWADSLVDIAEIEKLGNLNNRLRMMKTEAMVQVNLQQTREAISKAIVNGGDICYVS
ncbi:unnamed protein product [Adineta ricciae]|uniref:Uncharacterized protein n=1 Tax=Adineta ricciae TaxID=249248 RepID=A0A815IFS2_ADIRI|nr:unnamed protein product [Adineta ricciae]